MSRNRVIGRAGGLPWHEPEDLKHFRRVTMGHALVMGRRTWESIGRPLPGRRMIVVTRREDLALPADVERARDLEDALRLARVKDPAPCVIGGGEIYAQALPLATRLELTVVEREVDGDTLFPELDAREWREIARSTSGDLSFRTLVRQAPERSTA
ncbi:MAG: dihydrofolate reductase [Planctomycetes bacterium]|nr:dihydrofolate reductase [Planctomycetota bacterium]